MQAAEAHCTLVFDPYGVAVSYFYRIFGAFFSTQSAADAGILNRKAACTAQIIIVFIKIIGKRYTAAIKVTVSFFDNLLYYFISRFIGFDIGFCIFAFIG